MNYAVEESAKVIFTDGFFMGPTVICNGEDLEAHILRAMGPSQERSVAKTTVHLVLALAGDCLMANTPTARTIGGTYGILTNQAFWPGQKNLSYGVFIVNVLTEQVQMLGGRGFKGTEEYTPTIGITRPLDWKALARWEKKHEAVSQDRA